MTSSTPTRRRVLSDLDVNTPASLGAVQPVPKQQTSGSPTKPRDAGAVSLQTETMGVSVPVNQEADLGSKERGGRVPDERDPAAERSGYKRSKTLRGEEGGHKEYVYQRRFGQGFDGCCDDEDVGPEAVLEAGRAHDLPSSSFTSAFASPASSYSSHQLDDSQNTLITEPDEAPVPPTISFSAPPSRPVRLMTKREARKTAETLRLRLQLAQYKVRTNQIDVPLDRLQIKTIPSSEPKLPCIPRSAPAPSAKPAHRQPPPEPELPRIPRIPAPPAEINFRQPLPSASNKRRARADSIPSSPPPYLPLPKRRNKASSPEKEPEDKSGEGDDNEGEGCTTPLLPRQREDIANPPALGSPVWNDLTSSVVKGRAAVGLLRLKGQQ